MLSQGVIEEAKHMGDKLGVGSSQPRLHFDNSGEALLELLKGDIFIRFHQSPGWLLRLEARTCLRSIS